MDTKNDWLKDMLKIVVPLVVLILLFAGAIGTGIITFDSDETNNNSEVTATVAIYFEDTDIQSYEITTENNTVYNFLLEAAKIGGFSVDATYYGEYDSMLVNSIGNMVGGEDNKYWQFYVNEEYGTIGCDKQIVEDGDLIKWKFEGFEY